MKVLSTKVEDGIANEFQEHCKLNRITQASILRSLVLEELNKRKSITSIYAEINERFSLLEKVSIEICSMHTALMRAVTRLHYQWLSLEKHKIVEGYGGEIPASSIEHFKVIDEEIENLKKQIKDLDKADEMLRLVSKSGRRVE